MNRFRCDRSTLILGILLIMLLFPILDNDNHNRDSINLIEDSDIAYASTSPFNITHNNNFTSLGFPGLGTEENPFRIENLSIIEDGDCIKIRDTDAHFIISKCFFGSITHEQDDFFDDSLGSGVFLFNVSNAEIVDSYFQYKNIGCEIYWWSSDIVIKNNQFSFCFEAGILSSWATQCDIVDNSFSHNRYGIEALGGGGGTERSSFFNISSNEFLDNSWGIEMNAVISFIIDSNTFENCILGIHGHQENVTIANNHFESITSTAIDLSIGSSGLISRNLITHIGGTGIYLNFFTENISVSENVIEDCGTGIYSQASNVLFTGNNISYHTRGVEMQNSEDCIFMNNIVSNNDWFGLDVSGYTDNNSFFYNTFLDNIGPNARDRGGNNTWDDGVSRGNIWDDWIGFGSYVIPDKNLGVDRYPDNPQHGLQYHIILPPIGIGIVCVIGITILFQRRNVILAKLNRL